MLGSYRAFFAASAGVAGALIGLLFVALSVARERTDEPDVAALHHVRASAALTAFSNSLTVSLFALIPGTKIGWTTLVVAGLGLGFVVRSVLVLRRLSGAALRRQPLDGLFVLVMSGWFIGELVNAIGLIHSPHSRPRLDWVAIIVVVFFLTGIARAWELIGGPQYSLRKEAAEILRTAGADPGAPHRSSEQSDSR